MEDYRRQLTDLETLDAILAKAPDDHRLQKLLVLYLMKDKRTFGRFKRLAKSNPYAWEMLSHAKYALQSLAKEQSSEAKTLVEYLNGVTGFLNENEPILKLQSWEKTGYKKMFNNYFVESRFDEMSQTEKESLANKLAQVDFENLVERNRKVTRGKIRV
jgi:hypothetical protein